nr:hypothetical protein BaRGS_013719 [Batillaria attramentaria]
MELVQTKLWLPVALAILMLAVNSQQASAKPNKKNNQPPDGNGHNDFDQVNLVEQNFEIDFIRPSEGKPRDILLVLDSSSSINDTDFEVMKAGVKLLIDSLCGGFGMSDTNNRLSIIQFSTDRVGVHAFNHDQDPEELKRVVDSLEPLYGFTCTGWALDLAYTAFSAKYGARDFAEHDTLLITDGQSNCGEDLVWESNELQQRSNVYALGIGIGNDPDAASEIQSIVSNQDPRHLFSLANFQDFEVMVRNVQAASDKCQEIVVKK